jgi:hypothetical protein
MSPLRVRDFSLCFPNLGVCPFFVGFCFLSYSHPGQFLLAWKFLKISEKFSSFFVNEDEPIYPYKC